MSGRRNSRTSKFTESGINDLVMRLQALLPQLNQTSDSRVLHTKASVSMMQIIKETCSHISMLQREVKEHGERLAELVNSAYTSDVNEECLRRLHL